MKRGECYMGGHNGTWREAEGRFACMRHARRRHYRVPKSKRPKKRSDHDKLTIELLGMSPCLIGRLGWAHECEGPIERAHIKHRGMGGKRVPWYRNSWPGCRKHHTGKYGEHRMGVQSFDAKYGEGVRQKEADRIGDVVDKLLGPPEVV